MLRSNLSAAWGRVLAGDWVKIQSLFFCFLNCQKLSRKALNLLLTIMNVYAIFTLKPVEYLHFLACVDRMALLLFN
jgi:hypothetical protein